MSQDTHPHFVLFGLGYLLLKGALFILLPLALIVHFLNSIRMERQALRSEEVQENMAYQRELHPGIFEEGKR